MDKKGDRSSEDRSLRQMAEERYKKLRAGKPVSLSDADIQKLLHELEVHQIELEIQNEELLLAREKAEKALQDYSRIFDEAYEFSPSGYFTIDQTGRIVKLNLSGARLLGKERSLLSGSNIRLYINRDTLPFFNDFLQDVFVTNFKESCEIQLISPDNSPVFLHLEGVLSAEKNNCLVIAVDVTNRKLSEEIIRQQYYTLNGIIESFDYPVFSVDANYCYTSFNKAHAAGMKDLYNADINLGDNLFNFITVASDREKAKVNIDRTLAGEFLTEESFAGHEMLTRRYYEIAHYPIKGFDGKIMGVSIISRDVTDRKQAETDRKEQEENIRIIFDNVSDVIFTTNTELKITNVSPGIERILGYKVEDLLNQSVREFNFIAEGYLEKVIEDVMHVFSGEKVPPSTYKFYAKDGTLKYGEVSGSPLFSDGKIIGITGVARDVRERILAEESLVKLENRYRALIEKAPDGVVLINSKGNFTFISPTAKKMFGFKSDENIDFNPAEYTHPEDLPMVLDELNRVMTETNYNPTIQYRFQSKEGSWKWIESTFSNLLDNPDIEAIVINFRDIADRRKYEETIQHERIMLRTLIDNLPDPIYILDKEGRKLVANKADIENIGCETEAEVLGKNDLDLFSADVGERGHADNMTVINTGVPIVNREESFFDIKGVQHWLLTSKYPLYDSQGNISGLVGIGYDITERKRVEDTLRESNELNNSLLKTIPFEMDIVDEQGNILFMSEKLEALFGTKALGHKCWKYYRDDGTQCADCPLLKGINIGKTEVYETHGVFGGKIFEISHTGLLFHGKKAILEIFQDITDRKLVEFELIAAKERAEESNIRFQALHRASFGGISIHDKGIILDCNQGLAEMTGYSLDELIGMDGLLLISDKTRDMVLNNILTGYEKSYEAIGLRKNGEEFPMRLEARTIPYKGKNVRTVEFRDITEQKNTERELISAKERAEESERLKLAFLANMSHEIRTPMNGILGFMDLLLESDLTGDQRNEYIAIVKSSGIRLLDTINDIIDISKIESGQSRINSSDFDINSLIRHLYNFFLPEAREKGLTFSILEQLPAQSSRVKTDGNKVESMLTNLIKNALKFTRKGSIGIGCRLADNMLEFFVTDTGIGILPQQLSKIFDRFVQADTSLSRPYEGSGLGLSIARAYVEMLGGSISVESTPGKGSTFSFNIPWIPVDAKPLIPEQKSVSQRLLNIKAVILIAEDDNISYAYLSRILQSERIELIRAVNGLEAVNYCQDRPDISLVLMDIKMPEMDGYEATRQILTFRPDLPIVALTAYAFSEDRENARKSGCVDYLSKPLNKEALMKVLTQHLK